MLNNDVIFNCMEEIEKKKKKVCDLSPFKGKKNLNNVYCLYPFPLVPLRRASKKCLAFSFSPHKGFFFFFNQFNQYLELAISWSGSVPRLASFLIRVENSLAWKNIKIVRCQEKYTIAPWEEAERNLLMILRGIWNNHVSRKARYKVKDQIQNVDSPHKFNENYVKAVQNSERFGT